MDNAHRGPEEPSVLSSAQWLRLRDLFGDAEKTPKSERKAFLDRALAERAHGPGGASPPASPAICL